MPERLTDKEVLAAVRREVYLAGEEQYSRTQNREDAAAYFYGELPAAPCREEDSDRSAVVSTDVADAVEAVLAEILPAFAGSAPVEFTPLNPADEARADAETKAVTHVAQSSGVYMALNAAIKDALLRRAGVIKVYWEQRQRVSYDQPQAVMPDMLPAILQPRQEGETVDIESAEELPDGSVSVSVRRKTIVSRPRIEAVPLDEFLVDGNVSLPEADAARFLAHSRPISRSELVELGVDVDIAYDLTCIETARNESSRSRARDASDAEYETAHKSTEMIQVVEAYYQIDRDGDGIAEMRRILTGGGAEGTQVLLLDEPWQDQPFCVGVPYLGLYSWDGVSLYDKLREVQDIKTQLLRSLLDATERNFRQRIGAVRDSVNLDDLMTSTMGGIVRLNTPDGLVPIPDIQVPPVVFQTIQQMDLVRREKGGGAIDTAAQAQQISGDTAHGLERTMSAMEAVNAMVGRNLAETLMVPLYRKLHRLLREYWPGVMDVRSANQWQQEEPSQWPQRDDMVLSLGMSVGERTRRSAALQMTLQSQLQLMGMGSTLVSPANVYATVTDLNRMSGLPAPEQYWVDPASPEGQQAAQQAQQAAQQQAEQQQQAVQAAQQAQAQLLTTLEQIKAETSLQTTQLKAQVEAMKAEMQHFERMFSERVKLAGIEADLDTQEAQREIDRLQMRVAR